MLHTRKFIPTALIPKRRFSPLFISITTTSISSTIPLHITVHRSYASKVETLRKESQNGKVSTTGKAKKFVAGGNKTAEKEEKDNSSKSGTSTIGRMMGEIRSYWGLIAIGALLVIIVVEFIYRVDPRQSAGDLVRGLIYGYPYRDYVDLKKGTLVHPDESSTVYVPAEGHFHFHIPEELVRPGAVIREQGHISRRYGKMIASDILQNSVSCEWKRVDDVARDTKMSVHTPLLEMIKGTVYKSVEESHKTYPTFKVQRLEHIALHNEATRLDPLPAALRTATSRKDVEQDMVCVVGSMQDSSKKTLWFGELYFIRAPYLFHYSATYQPDKYELGVRAREEKMKPSQLQNAIRQVAESKTNRPDVQEKVVRVLQSPTADEKEISLTLRNQLLETFHDSFYQQLFK